MRPSTKLFATALTKFYWLSAKQGIDFKLPYLSDDCKAVISGWPEMSPWRVGLIYYGVLLNLLSSRLNSPPAWPNYCERRSQQIRTFIETRFTSFVSTGHMHHFFWGFCRWEGLTFRSKNWKRGYSKRGNVQNKFGFSAHSSFRSGVVAGKGNSDILNSGRSENCQKIFFLSKTFRPKMLNKGRKTSILGKFRGKIETLNTYNHLCRKCDAVGKLQLAAALTF